MHKAIIFDCFGGLAEDGWLPFKRKYIGDNAELATQVGDLGKQNEYGMISNAEYDQAVSDLLGVSAAEFREAVGRRVPNEELFAYIKNELKPQYKIGLMSNANYDVIHELFTPEQAGLFDGAVMSFESKLVKPDLRMFQLMADRLGVEPDECVFIDDIERYCVAAEELGMRSIVYQSPGQTRQILSEFLS